MYSKKKPNNNKKIMIAHEKMLKMVPQMQEEYKKRTESLQFRNNLLQTQKRNNYLNEYDRLSGYMNSHITPPLQAEIKEKMTEQVENRLSQLSKNVKKTFITPHTSLYNKHLYNKIGIKK